MAIVNFPANPTIGDQYNENGITYTWNGAAWTANGAENTDARYVQVTGDTMTGNLNVPSINDGHAGPNNLIINGAMAVAQRGTSATVSNGSNEGYSTVDRWFLNFNDSIGGATTFSQSTDAPAGFANSTKIQCSTTASGFSSNQYLALAQKFEGQNLQPLAYGTADAKSVTVSWYMKTDVYTDPISVTLFTIFGTPEYYTVSVTPTTSWAKYSVTVPGSLTATINNDNLRALDLQFVLAGNTSSAIAAAADSTAYSTTRADFRTDVGNFLSSTSNAIYITGVQLTATNTAVAFQHEDYGTTLHKCQRYYWRQTAQPGNSSALTNGVIWGTGTFIGALRFPTVMRATPTGSISDTSGLKVYAAGGNQVPTSGSIQLESTYAAELSLGLGIAGTNGWAAFARLDSGSAYIDFDAEL